jgi:hypothetical protein
MKGSPYTGLFSSGSLGISHADNMATTLGAELNLAFGQSEQSVVTAAGDIIAWMEMSTTLTHDDVSGDNPLATELLHTETLRVGVTTVT